LLTLRQICLVASELQPVIEDLTAVLGINICYVDPAVEIFGLENTLMAVGSNFIEVVAPVKEDTAAGRYLVRRGGNGGYMIITQTASAGEQAACRSRAEGLGVRVTWEFPLEAGQYMQLHPADTGGCFFEIDWHETNDHQGDWHPAGGTAWSSSVKTDVVSTITAAELQSADPPHLAERWSVIAGAPVQANADGKLEIHLNNASVRFVEESDDRGEGLCGIDIQAADPQKLLQAAADRDMKISDHQVMICGVRFNLV
jgi:hypothetical protein